MRKFLIFFFLFSTQVFAEQHFNLNWKFINKIQSTPRNGVRTVIPFYFNFPEGLEIEYLMLKVPESCNTYVTDLRTQSWRAVFIDQKVEADTLYVLFKLPEKEKTNSLRAIVETGLDSRPSVPCLLNFYSALEEDSTGNIPPPIGRNPEYADCAKVSADIQFYFRDVIEMTSVLESVVNGAPTCQVFVRFETITKLIKFSDARRKENKSAEYEILKNPQNETVKVDIVLKVSQQR